MDMFVLYYVPAGQLSEETQILGVYSKRELADIALDRYLTELDCMSEELGIAEVQVDQDMV